MPTNDASKKNLKILILSHTSDITGGAELSMLNVLDVLAEKYKVTPTFILRKPLQKMAGALDERGWKYIAVDYGFWSNVPVERSDFQEVRQEKTNNKAVLEIEKIINDIKPDVVITNSIVCPWAAIAAYLTGTPHIWFVREYGDLDHGRIFTLGREATFQAVDSMSDLVISNSVTLANHIKKYVTNDKVSTLYTPFNVAALLKKSREKITSPFIHPDSLKLVIASGSITASKGHLEIVEAAAKLIQQGKSVEVCLIGRPDNKAYYEQIQSVVKENNISDRIHFAGFVANPLPYMASADIGIMTSRMEAFGRVTFEYLALGKPVIGANSGATPEMVHDGKNGYLFDLAKPASLVQAIQHYLDNPELLDLHGTASKNIATDMMSKEQNIDAFYVNMSTMLESVSKQNKPIVPTGLIRHWLSISIRTTPHELPSIKKQLKQRVKHHIRPAYHTVRGAIARRAGR